MFAANLLFAFLFRGGPTQKTDLAFFPELAELIVGFRPATLVTIREV